MIWFNGAVESAVDVVKTSKSVLLVLIQGDDDLSKKYETILNEKTTFKPEHCICIKISYNSVAFEQFKKIYAIVPVPSIFLIGTNGIPLGIFCSQDPTYLPNIVDDAISKQNKENCETEKLNTSKNNITHAKDVEKSSPKVNSTDEKNNIDFECYNILVENKKMRFETRRVCPTFFVYDNNTPDKMCIPQKVQSARIQFRLPSNEIRSWEFPNMCTLRDVKLYLMETMKLRSGFKLLRIYPRIAFEPEDDVKTLTDLSLTPNATLIVVPSQDEAFPSRIKKMIMKKSLVFTFVTAIFQPVFVLFGYLKKFIMKTPEENKEKQNKRDGHVGVQKRFRKKALTSNIHGFAFDESDTDSDMNTDNGNSTQQK